MSSKSPAQRTAITPTRAEDYAEWYQEVIRQGDLAENSPVRGCMVIKPWGYTLWQNIQRELDAMFKATGHKNAYFPLFIPKSFLEKEAAHVEGFAKECAVVTHHRLVAQPDGGLDVDPEAKLEEPLIVRPTSETIIGAMFAKWVQSYRDLPLLINQWANVVRWELRTRMFLRTAEFLWQEGHTAHATEAEAREETMQMLDVYARFAEEWMAMPVLRGQKSQSEKFPGAVDTYCIEAMMQDRKALQAGTSHYLGQNFARASGIQYSSKEGTVEFCHTTSWGVSTRLIGGLVMTHSDDDGLILPPRLAPSHVVIMPMLKGDEAKIMAYANELAAALRSQSFAGHPIEVEIDKRDIRGGDKTWEWVKRGVPLRVEVGPRDVDGGIVSVARRDRSPRDRENMPRDRFIAECTTILTEMQNNMVARARAFRDEHTQRISSWGDFAAYFTPKNADRPEPHGGFAISPWCGSEDCEQRAKNELKATIRCLPLDSENAPGACVVCGAPRQHTAVFAKNY